MTAAQPWYNSKVSKQGKIEEALSVAFKLVRMTRGGGGEWEATSTSMVTVPAKSPIL